MRILAVTYRYGPNVIGGAEQYLYRLLSELARRGVDIDVATTTGGEIREIGQWAAVWTPEFPEGVEQCNGVRVHRVPCRNPPLWRLRQNSARLQRGLRPIEWERPLPVRIPAGAGVAGRGWRHPESLPSGPHRWTDIRAEILLNAPAARAIVFSACAIRPMRCRALSDGRLLGEFRLTKDIAEGRIELPRPAPERIEFHFDASARPWGDARELSADFYSLALEDEHGARAPIPLDGDWRRWWPADPESRAAWWMDQANSIRLSQEKLFVHLRGPRAPALARKAVELARGADLVLAHCMPQGSFPIGVEAARTAARPLALLPLAHLDDPYYHWPCLHSALRWAKVVGALSPFASDFYRRRFHARARWIGAGVDPAEFEGLEEAAAAFRARHNPQGAPVFVFLGRKTPQKRYDHFIEAIERLAARRPCLGWMIGPDGDGRPVNSPDVRFFGPLERRETLAALAAADALALPSDSESFGMVIAEGWMLGKPALGARACGAVASLIEDGVDGYLCDGPAEFCARMEVLIDNPDQARAMGARGRDKALNSLTWEKTADRFLAALDAAPSDSRPEVL